jgi:hypothetical protein
MGEACGIHGGEILTYRFSSGNLKDRCPLEDLGKMGG